jgi:hypothetical protein
MTRILSYIHIYVPIYVPIYFPYSFHICSIYPLANVYILMENHHVQWVNPLYMAIFNSYVTNYQRLYFIWFFPHYIPLLFPWIRRKFQMEDESHRALAMAMEKRWKLRGASPQ